MKRALALAEKGRGSASPNPMVGAVVVKAGEIVGEGYHQRAGGLHAEVFALQAAGERARGGSLYVTLEPCCHTGRTPPCTRAILAAGVIDVHAAMIDPNPLVSGGGAEELRQAGVRVTVGEREAEARRQNEAFVTFVSKRRPFVILKYAMSLDGKIATAQGDSRGLTGAAWQRRLHLLRSHVDAILVGIGTALVDDPLLTARLPGGTVRQPLRVVLDSTLRLAPTARMLAGGVPGRTLIATTARADMSRAEDLRRQGAEVISVGESRVDIVTLLRVLAERQLTSLLVEGGGEVHASFVEAGLVDKVLAIVSPVLLGGAHSPTPVAGGGVAYIAQGLRLRDVTVKRAGRDVVISGYPAATTAQEPAVESAP